MPLTIDCAIGDSAPDWHGPGGPAPWVAPLPLPAGQPPSPSKLVLGGRMEHQLDSENFTIGWQGDDATEEQAQRALDALERSWTALVVEQGWPQPVSSDKYLLWVVLDPTLNGTGLTVELFPSEYPTGYPVIYLNPTYASYKKFWSSLSAHEFAHDLQFGLRGDWVGGEDSWYWEASAEWAAELALPELEEYAASAEWYAQAPELRYSSMQDAHQYGMVLLNASLEQRLGEGTLLRIWTEGGAKRTTLWDEVLAAATQEPVEDIWAQFTADYGLGLLRDSSLYQTPTLRPYEEGASGTLAYLGTHYYAVQEDLEISACCDVVLSAEGAWGERVRVPAGSVLTVTGLQDPSADYSLSAVADSPDSALDSSPDNKDGRRTCACASSHPATSWPAPLTALFLLWRSKVGRCRPRRLLDP